MTTVAPAARPLYDKFMATCGELDKNSLRIASVYAGHVASWYALQRPDREPSLADRDNYIAARVSKGVKEKSAANEWRVVSRYLNGGRRSRSTAKSRIQSVRPAERKAHIATVAETARAIREPASASPAKLTLVENKPTSDALATAIKAMHAVVEAMRKRHAAGDATVTYTRSVHAATANKAIEALNAFIAARVPLIPPPAFQGPSISGIPVSPAWMAHTVEMPFTKSQSVLYWLPMALTTGIGPNGDIYDHYNDEARALLMKDLCAANNLARNANDYVRGKNFGSLSLHESLLGMLTDRLGEKWHLCELHVFLWACREYCVRHARDGGSHVDLNSTTPLTRGAFAGKTVHDVITRIDDNIGGGLFALTLDDYTKSLASEPGALAHFERVRLQYAAYSETKK